MSRKTQGVYDLVSEVLVTIPEPHGEDITEDVCCAIEGQTDWSKRYKALEKELTRHTVNVWIGQYTKKITGRESGPQVKATRSKLIGSYTKLPL